MKVSDVMTAEVQLCTPLDTLKDAAEAMMTLNVGLLPVTDGDRLVGMITDRDIVIRGVAMGLGPDSPVRTAMTEDVKYCFEDQELEEVTQNMGDIQVRRLPVLNRDKRLVGIIALGDIARADSGDGTAEALSQISEPTGQPAAPASRLHEEVPCTRSLRAKGRSETHSAPRKRCGRRL
jgi:CBS domain-containing protein